MNIIDRALNALGALLGIDMSRTKSTLKTCPDGTVVRSNQKCPVTTGGTTVLAPVNLSAPSITGTITKGQTLSCSTGSWSNSPTEHYQWKRGGSAISAATASTYILASADVGATISCDVIATNAGGTATATASGVGPIIDLAPVNTVAPVASGTPTVGQNLSVTTGTWTNSPTYGYQWKRNGIPISAATASTYTVATADNAQSITCTVTASNSGGSASAASNGLGPVGSVITIYDTRFGTDATTAAATGWFTFGLHSGNRRIWVNSAKADDTGDGLSAATAKKTFNAAYTLFGTGFTAGDQLMIATGTYTESGTNNLTNKAGISAAYPTAILSYDPADAANSAKYGKLTGSSKPVIAITGDSFSSFTGSGLADYIAVQGISFDGQNADQGSGSPTFQPRHDGIVFQNCTFADVQLTLTNGGTYDATGASYNQTGNISKCVFYGQWASSANMQGIYLHGTKDFYIQDNVFAHVGWRMGSARDDTAANGGANAVNHGNYVSASELGVRLDRNFYCDTSADGLNLRSNGIATSNASLDEPIAGNIGGFSGSIAEAPSGILAQVTDWWIGGSADINSVQTRGQGPWTTNTVAGSFMRNIAAIDSPKFGVSADYFTIDYNNGNSPNISSITHSGTTATVTLASADTFLTTGRHVSVDHATPINYNVVDVPVTVIDSTHFTYTMATTPATNATSVGVYTAQVPQFMLFDKVHSYNFARTLDGGQSNFNALNAINNTWTNAITDALAPGAGNMVASGALFPNYKTRDQVVTAVLNGVGIAPGATYYARKAQLVNAAVTRPDLPWSQWLIGVGFPAMNLTPTYSTPAYQTFTDTPLTIYSTALADLTISTLNFTHGVNSSATLSGVCANPVLTCSDLPAGLSISGRVISGSATSAGTPTIHIVETTQDGGTTHTTAFTLNIS